MKSMMRPSPAMLGVLAGAVLAAVGLARTPAQATHLDGEAAARVNGVAIPRADLERALAAVATDRGAPLDPEGQRRVLDRLIDEELLVQHGLRSGMAARDPKVRADVSRAVIDWARVSDETSAPPTEGALRAFTQERPDLFSRPPRLRVAQRFFDPSATGDAEARRRAEAATRRWRATGDPGAGDRAPVDVPAGPATPEALLRRLGPTATRGALSLTPGEISAPLRSGAGYHVVHLVERVAAGDDADPTPDVVLAAFTRARADARLRRLLDDLRGRARIEIP
jgi:parvulin-like peptidyl-prolyl isomerase